MLAEDETVYELIDKMFVTISECFTSRIINIGMDEAIMIGKRIAESTWSRTHF